MKYLFFSILFSVQAFGSSLTIEYPQREKQKAKKIEIVCEKSCFSGSKELDAKFFKDKIGHLVQIEAKGELPKSFEQEYLKKITVIEGRSKVVYFMGRAKNYYGTEFENYSEIAAMIAQIEFMAGKK